MAAALMLTAAFAADGDKTIMLGTDAIDGWDSTNGYDYIYYGTDDDSPIQWRVLDDQTNMGTDGLFLLSEYVRSGEVSFNNNDYENNNWQDSEVRQRCEEFYEDSFSEAEREAILATSKDDSEYIQKTYNMSGTPGKDIKFAAREDILNNDFIFLLSAEEVNNAEYGFIDNKSRKALLNEISFGYAWWLRSPNDERVVYSPDVFMYAGIVEGEGLVGRDTVEIPYRLRPAFNLNSDAVLFTSAAVGGKSSSADGWTAVDDYDANEWKLTLLDENRNFAISNAKIESRRVDFSYSGAQTGANEYISVFIVDNGQIIRYGRILQLDGTIYGTDGRASFTLPTGVYNLDKNLKFYVFNEQYNGGENDDTKLTDYASKLIDVQSAVKKSSSSAPTEYNLRFDTNGGETMSTTVEQANTPIDLDQYVPTRDGYKFVGWYADEELTKPIDTITLAENATIYAKWEKIEEEEEEIKEEVPTETEEEQEETTEPEETAVSFADVRESDWFYQAVSYAVENNLMIGMGDGTFSPNTPLHREMLAVILYNLAERPASDTEKTFTDVSSGQWYTEAILWAAENNIVAGYDDGSYGVGQPVTREEFAAILYRFANFYGYDTTVLSETAKTYSDFDKASSYAEPALIWAVDAGIMNGMDDGTLAPQGQTTRAEAATMLMNFCEKIK